MSGHPETESCVPSSMEQGYAAFFARYASYCFGVYDFYCSNVECMIKPHERNIWKRMRGQVAHLAERVHLRDLGLEELVDCSVVSTSLKVKRPGGQLL